MKVIQEGEARVAVSVEKKISRRLEVFYNPAMKSNRDISILLLQSAGRDHLKIADPLAGSGIRTIRFLKELKKGLIKSIYVNDGKKEFPKNFSSNLRLNTIKRKINVSNEDASIFLLRSGVFDYIDIDPFGSPNPFLDAGIKKLWPKGGILAVTATDTAPLCGTYPTACVRKYWAKPLRNYLMHEVGLRILIRKVQLVGAQYDKALVPVLSYYEKHYMRIYFRCEGGKSNVDKVLKQHGMFQEAGPLWLGKLWDGRLVRNMVKHCDKENKEVYDLLKTIQEESVVPMVGFFDTHILAKRLKLKRIPRKQELIDWIRKKWKAAPTHFSGSGIRSTIPEKELIKKVKQLNKIFKGG